MKITERFNRLNFWNKLAAIGAVCSILAFLGWLLWPKSGGDSSSVQQASSGRDTYQVKAEHVTIGQGPAQPTEPPLKDRIRSVLRRINPEIIDAIDRGAPAIRVMISTVNQVDLQKMQREEGFTDYLSVTNTGGTIAGGSGNRIGDHINDIAEGMMNGYELKFKQPLRIK